jgi:hypothetical protein
MPLSYTIGTWYEAVVKLLLIAEGVDNESEFTSKSYKGRTLLSLAVENGHEVVVR